MKQKNIKIFTLILLFSFLMAGFLGFGSIFQNKKAEAAACSASDASWYVQNGDGTNSQISGSITVDPTKTYLAVADFINCQNQPNPKFGVVETNSSGVTNPIANGNFPLGSKISSSSENHNAKVTFPESGSYSFTVTIGGIGTGVDLQNIGNAPSLQVTVAGAPSATTCQKDADCANAGSSSYGYVCVSNQCKEDANLPLGSHCNSQQANDDCANGAQCSTSNNICVNLSYGCLASNGIYACFSSNSAALAGGCTADNVTNAIPADECGCTDANYSAGTCKNGHAVQPTNGATPGATGQGAAMQNNSASTLYNPIPNYNTLTDLLINIMKGFLGIIGIWAVAFIVIGGFRLVISQGNEEAVTAAKKTITWAILGLLVAVLSFAIIAIVQNLVGVQVQNPPTTNTTGNPPSNTTGNPPNTSNTGSTGNPPN